MQFTKKISINTILQWEWKRKRKFYDILKKPKQNHLFFYSADFPLFQEVCGGFFFWLINHVFTIHTNHMLPEPVLRSLALRLEGLVFRTRNLGLGSSPMSLYIYMNPKWIWKNQEMLSIRSGGIVHPLAQLDMTTKRTSYWRTRSLSCKV